MLRINQRLLLTLGLLAVDLEPEPKIQTERLAPREPPRDPALDPVILSRADPQTCIRCGARLYRPDSCRCRGARRGYRSHR